MTSRGIKMDQITELKEEIASLRKRQLTHELTTGMFFIELIRAVETASPGISEVLKQRNEAAMAKFPTSAARNDPHTEDAFKLIDKMLEVAMGSQLKK